MEVKNSKNLKPIFTVVFIAIFCVAIFMGTYFYLLVFNVFPDDKMLIKLSDRSQCILSKYSFEMPDMTVSFSVDQVDAAKLSSEGQLLLNIPIASTAPEQFIYRLRAEYENCPELKSEPRVVGRGYIIYESISDNKIYFDIRSK